MIDHETLEEMISARNALLSEGATLLTKLGKLKRLLTQRETATLRKLLDDLSPLVASKDLPADRTYELDTPISVEKDWQETHDTGGVPWKDIEHA